MKPKDRQTSRSKQMDELTGRDKGDVRKRGSEGKRAIISCRFWSSTNMTPADMTLFEAACHPPGGYCRRQIARQTACPAPGPN